MAGAVLVVGASVGACGSSSSTSSATFCNNLNNADKTIKGELQQGSPPAKAALDKDIQTLNGLASSAPQQLKKPLSDLAGFLKDAEALTTGGTPDSAAVRRITAEEPTLQSDSQTLGDYVTKNCKITGK
ncbi:MAG: hypothetical protein M3063_16340 [Actinomycetota bacterium]|nr:hypothetical protein [Actinomycetota bacterium]